MLSSTRIAFSWRALGRAHLRIRQLSTAQPQVPKDADYEDFFRCTTRRWLSNEEQHLARRYHKFDVPGLQRVAAAAAGATDCVSMEKMSEASNGKSFALRFDNGAEVVVRMPAPGAVPAHLAVASEAATSDFARTRLQIPAPRVLAWSSGKQENPVGAEYIISEKLDGVWLWNRWFEVDDVTTFMQRTLADEQRFAGVRFSQIGNLYYKEDVAPALQGRRLYAAGVPDDAASDRFRIGPSARMEFWADGRMDMDLDRGPWPDAKGYAIALANGQRRWLQTCAKPRAPGDPFHVFDEGGPAAHIAMLDRFLAIAPLIFRDEAFFQPTLWHTGNYASRMIVAAEGPLDVRGVTGWDEWIGPRFQRAQFASLFSYIGGIFDTSADELALPADFESLDETAQFRVQAELALAEREKAYADLVWENHPAHRETLADPRFERLRALFLNITRTWPDGLLRMREALLQIAENWEDYAEPGVACPLKFPEEEVEAHRRLFEKVQVYESDKGYAEEELRVDEEGSVDPEDYENIKEYAETIRAKWEEVNPEFPWPLQDGVQSSSPR